MDCTTFDPPVAYGSAATGALEPYYGTFTAVLTWFEASNTFWYCYWTSTQPDPSNVVRTCGSQFTVAELGEQLRAIRSKPNVTPLRAERAWIADEWEEYAAKLRASGLLPRGL